MPINKDKTPKLNGDDKKKFKLLSLFERKVEEEIDETLFAQYGEVKQISSSEEMREKTLEKNAIEFSASNLDIEEYFPDLSEGLTEEQVKQRIQDGHVNKELKINSRSYFDILRDNVLTFFNLLCAVMAVALIYVESFSDLTFLAIIIINLVIGTVQEIRAKKKLDKLKLMTAPVVRVIRGKKEMNIAINELVVSDIMKLSSGKQISSDSMVVQGEIEVNEALLTGESVPVIKKVGDRIFAGSYVVSGTALAKVYCVGEENYISKLSLVAKKYKKPKSELLASLNIIIRTVSAAIIPLGAMMFYSNYSSTGGNMYDAVTKTTGSLVGMIPAGLFLLTSISLALGSMKIASNNALVQESYAIEMLARVDMLCLDKTGTITDGTMSVCMHEDLTTSERKPSEIISSMMYSLNDNNQTAVALKNYYTKKEVFFTKKIYPFSSDRKFSAVTFDNDETYFIGAPEFVLRTPNEALDAKVYNYSVQGYRVLLLAKTSEKYAGTIPTEVTPVSLVVIQDRVREDAPQILRYFKEQGVKVKIISGDNPITVAEVARRAGVEGTEKHISLDGLSNKEIITLCDEYTVFGRVSPEQKLLLIKTLKKNGHTVAMTGDGVNDILAMKEADCSIAMASGSEAVRNVAHLVLMDSNFSSMPVVVSEGRRVINNIQRSASLFLVKTVMSVLLSILTILLSIPYPFTPSKLLIYEFFVTGVPSFFLALEPSKEKISGNFLYNVMKRAIPGALVTVLYILILNWTSGIFGLTTTDIDSMCVVITTFVGYAVLADICKPFNVMRGVLFVCVSLAGFAVLAGIPSFFSVTMPTLVPALIMIIMMLGANYLLKFFKLVVTGLASTILMEKHEVELETKKEDIK
ncbi:MAG: HAD-IC family P-type ATPase [Bacillota bacterium]